MALEIVKTGTIDSSHVESVLYAIGKNVMYSELHEQDKSVTMIYSPDEKPILIIKRTRINDSKYDFEISIDRSFPNFAHYLKDFRLTMISELQMLNIIYPEKKLINIDDRTYVKADNAQEVLNISCLLHVYGCVPSEFPVLLGVEESETYDAGEFSHKSISESIKDLEEKIAILKSI